jgi:hypothetical protein
MKVRITKFMEKIFDPSYKDYKKSRKWLIGLLESEIVEIEFTKKDGTDRVMKCTLQEDYLPEYGVIEIDKDRWKKDALAVFDIENDGWRSFRWDSVKQISFSIGEGKNA